MIGRFVLAYVLAVVVLIPRLADFTSHTLSVLMTTEVPGGVQVFYDIGNGLNEQDSATAAFSPGRHEYALPLPVGEYRQLRIDPGAGPGRYAIERAVIRRSDGSIHLVIPLAELNPSQQLSLVERTPDRLVAESPAGSNDPQLLYVPAPSFWLTPERTWPRVLIRLLSFWTAALLAVILLEIVLRPAARVVRRWLILSTQWSAVHPRLAIMGAAALGTLLATYPVVFMNRSLVSPNNHGLPMLYDEPPYLPGSDDLALEDIRGSDVGATMWHILEYTRMQRAALSHGELPLWNRFNSCGLPLWAQGLTFLLDPLHWVTLVGGDAGLDLKFVLHRFVFATGVGFAALVAGAWLPAGVAAAAVPFLGFFSFRLNHPAAFSLTYGPWILVAWMALAAARGRAQMARAALFLAVASALVLVASTPKEGFVVLLSCETAGVMALAFHSGRSQDMWRRLAFAAVAGITALLITAPHWLLFLDNLRSSLTVYDTPHVVVGPIYELPLLLLGSLSPVLAPTLHVTATLLLVAAMMAPRGLLRRPMILACAAVAAGLLAVAFGAVPVEWLLRVPLVANIFHIDTTFTSVALLLLSVVYAYGVEVLMAASSRQAWLLTLAVGLVAISLTWYAASWTSRPYDLWLIGLLLVSLTALPLLLEAARRAPEYVLPTVAALVVGMLSLLPGGLQLETGVPALDRVLFQPRPRVDLDAVSPAVDAVHAAMTEPARALGAGTLLWPGSSPLFGLEGIGGPDSLLIATYQELLDEGGIERPWGPLANAGWPTLVSPSNVNRVAPLLDMINVGYVFAAHESMLPGLIELPTSRPDRIKALRRPTAWPRAFFGDGVATYANARDLIALSASHNGPLAAVQSSDREAVAATRGLPAIDRAAVPASGYELTTNATSFVVEASGPGVAVLAESFLQDHFRATLNGRRVPYFRVNHAFKAVAIPAAGTWRVTFEYRPRRWALSLALAGVGLLIVGALGLTAREHRGNGGTDAAARRSSVNA